MRGDTKEQPATSDAPSDLTDFSPPPASDNSHADFPDHSDPASKRLSNISSDFDSADRSSLTSSGQNQDSEGEGEEVSAQPHLMVVHVTPEGTQEKHGVHQDASCATCVTQGNLSNQEQSVTTSSSDVACVTEVDLSNAVDGPVMLEKTDELSVSPDSTNVSEDTLSADNSLCMDSVSLSTSTLMEDDVNVEDVTLGPDESHNSDYWPDIYSNTPVNISDATFSDVSVERSHRSKTRPSKLSGLGSSSSLKTSSDGPTDSEGTPPVSLDSEGAEELSDTASWPRTPSRRTMSDLEIVNHEDAPLEGSHSSTSSGSSLSRSPGSTKQGLRLLADSWADYSPPGQGYVQFVAVSDRHIWCVSTNDHIYYCPTHFSVVTWTQLSGSARMMAVSNTGDVIWSIDRKNYAYARTGINANHLTGKKWQPVEKDMRYVAVEGTALWGIKVSRTLAYNQ